MKKNIIKPIIRISLRDEVYHTLKKSIVTLDLKPEERLNDKELAEKFGISRTPVREALKRLEDEGLVESLPGSTTRVAPLKVEEAKNAFTVVAALHALAVRLAFPKLSERNIEELVGYNGSLKYSIEQRDVVKAIEADTEFHNVFLKAAGNPEILFALERSIPKIQRLEISQFSTQKGLFSVEQHNQIISACKSHDSELAVRLVEENWLSLGDLPTQAAE